MRSRKNGCEEEEEAMEGWRGGTAVTLARKFAAGLWRLQVSDIVAGGGREKQKNSLALTVRMPEIQLGAHTVRTHGVQLLRLHMHNWLILALIAVIEGVLNIIEPFHRFVGEDMMTDLKYPLKDNTIPFWAIPFVAVLLPLIIINIYYFIRRDVYDLHHATLGLLYSVLVTGVITDAIKDCVGRPRPDFFWRCFPDGKGVFDNVTKNVLCTGNKLVVKEGHKSFPSGHTSWSFAGLGFLALYMSGKVRAFDRKGHAAKLCIVFLPYLVAALVGVSLVDDYWHHWEDVFGGAIIGTVVATFFYLQFFPPPYDSDGWGPYAYFQVLADSQNGRQATNNNASCLTIQSLELESVYVESGHRRQLSRTNTHDASPVEE
ncbi:hypothetical protein LWI29_009322 [Acer saccharum]|uniref:Phosphatidic acid phosphatase type 2/haloperoxidase domain-containing protein n=1 Tax=Acer saccharum TaxID=4024 RepID=A0AA39RIF5_ACESA|nr:hypothetical protein LWI29_009322 [Acer saccharum]